MYFYIFIFYQFILITLLSVKQCIKTHACSDDKYSLLKKRVQSKASMIFFLEDICNNSYSTYIK